MQRYGGFRADLTLIGYPQPTPFVPRATPGTPRAPAPAPRAAREDPPTMPPRASQPIAAAGPPDAPGVGSTQRLGLDFRSLVGAATSLLHSGARSSVVPTELTTLALSHRTGKIVGVTSRAGGVGKTAIAA